MTEVFNLLDASEPGLWLDDVAAAQGAGHDAAFVETLAAHLRTALEKPLKKHEAAMREVEEMPARAPPGWREEKWRAVFAAAAQGLALPFYRFDPSLDPHLRDRVAHVADWIASAMVNDAPWLSNRDERGRPKKLMKIGSVEQAVALADDTLRRAFQSAACNDQAFEAEVAAGDIEIAMELDDGSRMVRLLTPRALDRESAQMGHCVGAGSYDVRLTSGRFRYYSLRDPGNKPHATLEVETATKPLLQCQGKANKAPVARYVPAIQDFVQRERFSLADVPANRTGLIEQAGRYYDIYNLPAGLAVEGNLDLRDTAITALPQGLRVGGGLDLRDTRITALPEGLQVGGSLDLSDTGITALPEGLQVGGWLDLFGSGITALPQGLWVGGMLNLRDMNITALPEGLQVGDWLDLSGTGITALPEGLQVGGWLDLSGTGITALPEGLQVGGAIYTERGDFRSVDDARRAFSDGRSIGGVARKARGLAPG